MLTGLELFVRDGHHVGMARWRPFGTGIVVLGIACTSAEVPPKASVPSEEVEPVEVEPVEAEPVEVEPAEAEPPHQRPVSPQPWVWYHALPPKLAGGMMGVGTSSTAYQRIKGDPRRYDVAAARDGLELRRERLTRSDRVLELEWSRSIPGSTPGEVVVLVGLRSTDVIVGVRSDDEYELQRYSEDGDLQWSTTTADPEALGDSETALQLAMGGTNVVVYNRRDTGSYLDEVDFETGRTVARTIVEPVVLSSRFEWPPAEGVRGRRLGHRWPGLDGSHVVRKKGKALVVEHAGPDGKKRWSTTVDAQGGGWWNSAALVEQGDTLVVVPFHGASSGAVAYGLARRDGAVRFEASPGSIGSIGHSKYSNDLALTVDEAGHVFTHGKESGGHYIGVLDVEAGRLLGHEVWRD